jgi:iron complex outermembrane receptor protein
MRRSISQAVFLCVALALTFAARAHRHRGARAVRHLRRGRLRIPKVHGNFLVEYDVAAVPGLTGVFDWQYNSNRAANDNNTTFASSYNTFDLGARCKTKLWGRNTTWRAAVQNLADERYWSSVNPSNITGTNRGNMVAHVGAPRTFSASVTVDF